MNFFTKVIDKRFFLKYNRTRFYQILFMEVILMNFKPLGERVLVERLEEDTKTASGIIIPDNAKEKPLMGIVKAVGSEVKDVKTNDKIVFGKYSGTEVKLDGVEYLILKLEDVLGVIA